MDFEKLQRFEYCLAIMAMKYAFRSRSALRLGYSFQGGQWGTEATRVSGKYENIADTAVVMLRNISPRLRVYDGSIKNSWSLQ